MDFIDIYQQSKISDANYSSEKALNKAENLNYEVVKNRKKIESLTILCQAMWEIIREGADITDKELLEKVEDIDVRDGRKDGKMSSKIINCSNCGYKANTARNNCDFCGESILGDKHHIFE